MTALAAKKHDVTGEARDGDGKWSKQGAGQSITRALTITGTGPTAADVRAAVADIDRVHSTGPLPTIPLTVGRYSGSSNGVFTRLLDGTASEIKIKPQNGDPFMHPRMTTVHEIGHFLGHENFADDFGPNKKGGVDARPIMAVIEKTARVTTLRDMFAKGYVVVDYPSGNRVKEKLPKKFIGYILQPHELFADAYAHYITFRSGDEVMQKERYTRSLSLGISRFPSVWDAADFEPVAKAFDAFFKKAGWLK